MKTQRTVRLYKSMRSNFKMQTSSQKGQVVVEYILLLSIAVSIAIILVTMLIKRDPTDAENSGALIRKWHQIQQTIGKDVPN